MKRSMQLKKRQILTKIVQNCRKNISRGSWNISIWTKHFNGIFSSRKLSSFTWREFCSIRANTLVCSYFSNSKWLTHWSRLPIYGFWVRDFLTNSVQNRAPQNDLPHSNPYANESIQMELSFHFRPLGESTVCHTFWMDLFTWAGSTSNLIYLFKDVKRELFGYSSSPLKAMHWVQCKCCSTIGYFT